MTRHLGAAGTAAVFMVALAGCGNDDGEGAGAFDVAAGRPPGFAATPEYLAAGVADLETVPHRFEMTMAMGFEVDGEITGLDPSTIVGEFDGERQYGRVDGGIFDGMGGGSEPAEQIVDIAGQAVYIRDPDAADQLEELPEYFVTDYMEAVADLRDKWGRADLTQMADVLPEDWEREVTQIRLQSLDPASFAGLVANAESVEELPAEEIQGEQMVGLAATVTAEDFAEAQQTPGTTATDQPVVEPEPGSFGDVLNNLEYKVEAWIDSNGNIRRLVLDQSDILDQMAEHAPNLEDGPNIGTILTLDLFDYGEESIAIDLPAAEETVDITAAFRTLFDS